MITNKNQFGLKTNTIPKERKKTILVFIAALIIVSVGILFALKYSAANTDSTQPQVVNNPDSQEYVASIHSDIIILADGDIEVHETWLINFQHQQFKHGLNRTIPSAYIPSSKKPAPTEASTDKPENKEPPKKEPPTPISIRLVHAAIDQQKIEGEIVKFDNNFTYNIKVASKDPEPLPKGIHEIYMKYVISGLIEHLEETDKVRIAASSVIGVPIKEVSLEVVFPKLVSSGSIVAKAIVQYVGAFAQSEENLALDGIELYKEHPVKIEQYAEEQNKAVLQNLMITDIQQGQALAFEAEWPGFFVKRKSKEVSVPEEKDDKGKETKEE